MTEISYRYRAHPLARALTFRLGDKALVIEDGLHNWSVPYGAVSFVESFDVRFLGGSPTYRQHILRTPDGRSVALGAGFRDRWRVADQRTEYETFIAGLIYAISEANPDLEYVHGRRLLNRAAGLGGKLAVLFLRLIRHTNLDRSANFAAWVMRRIGPRLRGHGRALEQIALAFPEKSPAEHRQIALGMWDNLARTAIEYSQLDRMWQHDPADPAQSRIIKDEASTQILTRIKQANRRTLHFSLHIANWELCAIAGPQYGVRSLIPYRRLKNEPLTAELVRLRIAAGTTPMVAGPSMIAELKKEFREGDAIGMLIDQHYARGIEVTFFGRPTKFNPLYARLARIYDCPLYGSRIIRRSDGRFDYQIVGPIEPARDARGRVDVHATTQLVVSILEGWIREHPEQWMWLHRVWR